MMLSFRSAVSMCLVCKFVIVFHVTLTFPIRSSSKLVRKSKQSIAIDLAAPCCVAWLLNTSAVWFVWFVWLIGWFLVASSFLARSSVCVFLLVFVVSDACFALLFASWFSVLLRCSVFPSCFVTLCAEAEKIPFGSGKKE